MSIRAINWAWRLDLPVRDKFVLVALADWADEEGVCFPAIKTIVKKCGLSKGSIQRALLQLTEWGLLERTPQFRKNKSQTINLYRLRLDRSAPIEVAEAAVAQANGEGVTENPPVDPSAEFADTSKDSGDSSGEGVQADSPGGTHDTESGGDSLASPHRTFTSEPESTPYPLKGEAAAPARSAKSGTGAAEANADAVPERATRAGFWQLHEQYQQANWLAFVGKTDLAIKRWDALTIDERIASLMKFPAYVRSQKAQWRAWKDANPSTRGRQPKPSSMEDYLGNRLFRDLPAPVDEPSLPAVQPVSPLWVEAVRSGSRSQFDRTAVFLAHDSDGFRAWLAAERRAGVVAGGPRKFIRRNEETNAIEWNGYGRFFASEMPPLESEFSEQKAQTEKVPA